MIGLVVLLLCWECGGLQVVLPPGMPDRPPKDVAREEFVRGWLEQRMAKEVADRLEQAQQALEEQPPVEPWLPTLRERLEQAQRAVELEQTQRAVERDHALTAVGQLKPLTARDAERQEFLRRWLELRMAKEKAAHEAQ